MGDYYINVPASSESYESPALFAADPTQEPASGGNGHIVVGGIYFHWEYLQKEDSPIQDGGELI